MIKITQKGDFSKVEMFLERLKEGFNKSIFDKYGRMGVEALRNATPVDTGLTASSWSYQVNYSSNSVTIEFHNSHINKHVNFSTDMVPELADGLKDGIT